MFNNKTIDRRLLAIAATLLTLGVIEYVLFRGWGSLSVQLFPPKAMAWAIFSLPGGFWAASGVFAIYSIWANHPLWTVIYILVFLGCAIALEIGQLYGWLRGTFDPVDLVLMTAGIVLSVLICESNKRKRRIT